MLTAEKEKRGRVPEAMCIINFSELKKYENPYSKHWDVTETYNYQRQANSKGINEKSK